ncbi:MAG: acyl-CoA thioesterase [Chloroflexi bacterium]|nr:acyl-CoA thioesterase [Chloroflexota bacterium]
MAFRFYQPVEVRYSDLDTQGHVNNARYLTYMEQGRVGYLTHLGLWKPRTMPDVGIILAEIRVTFKRPILFGQPVRVGLRVPRLGNKSFPMLYRLEDAETGELLATGESIQVCFDYRNQRTIPIPPSWRQAIASFEDIPPTTETTS